MTKIKAVVLLSLFLIGFFMACDARIGKAEYLGKIVEVKETEETHFNPALKIPTTEYYYIILLDTREEIKFNKEDFKIKLKIGQDLYREKITVKYAPDYYEYFVR